MHKRMCMSVLRYRCAHFIRAVCTNFATGGGGVNLGYLNFKKRRRRSKQRQGEHWKTMFKK